MTSEPWSLRFAWLLTVGLAILSGMLAYVLYRESFAPLSPSQNVADAFLYARPSRATGLAILALFSIAIGFWTWLRRRGQTPEAGVFLRVVSTLALALGVLLAAVAVPFYVRDIDNVTVLSESGVTLYRRGGIESEAWSSLNAVAFDCTGGVGVGRQPWPRVFLRFAGGRTIPDLLGMRPIGRTGQEALAVFDSVRLQHGVPIFWNSDRQELSFREGDVGIVSCVNRFLDRFPETHRRALLALLS